MNSLTPQVGGGGGDMMQMFMTSLIGGQMMNSLSGNNNNNGGGNGGQGGSSMWIIILMMLMPHLTSLFTAFRQFITQQITQYIAQKRKSLLNSTSFATSSIDSDDDPLVSGIQLEVNSLPYEAIMSYMTSLDDVHGLIYDGNKYVINCDCNIEICTTNHIWCQITSSASSNKSKSNDNPPLINGVVNSNDALLEPIAPSQVPSQAPLTKSTTRSNGTNENKGGSKDSALKPGSAPEMLLQIHSIHVPISKLKSFIDDHVASYRRAQVNNLGTRKYYFDEITQALQREANGDIRYKDAAPMALFTQIKFRTTRDMDNIFGPHLNVMKERVDFFINNRAWYETKGVPYTLGIMLHGPPGTGKTSVIKAISNHTNRHLINLRLTPYTTKTQLHQMFFSNVLHIKNGLKMSSLQIPMEERIYVLEDIDCLTNIVNRRAESSTDPTEQIQLEIKQLGDELQETTDLQDRAALRTLLTEAQAKLATTSRETGDSKLGDGLTLSFLLNLIDGILETPGRIMIITTNHPELLDDALKRPGRMDVILNVGYCVVQHIQDMFDFFFSEILSNMTDIDNKVAEFNFGKIWGKHNDFNTGMTPAELGQICMNNYNNAHIARDKIIQCVAACLEKRRILLEEKTARENAKAENAKAENAKAENAKAASKVETATSNLNPEPSLFDTRLHAYTIDGHPMATFGDEDFGGGALLSDFTY